MKLNEMKLSTLASLITISGWITLLVVDWKIAIGTFLIVWGKGIDIRMWAEHYQNIVSHISTTLSELVKAKDGKHDNNSN